MKIDKDYLPHIKIKDLRIIKEMWNEEPLSISEICRRVFDIENRNDLQKKYKVAKYRLEKMVKNNIMVKKSIDGGTVYSIADNVFVGNLKAKMNVMGEIGDWSFDKCLFINIRGTAMFVSLENV